MVVRTRSAFEGLLWLGVSVFLIGESSLIRSQVPWGGGYGEVTEDMWLGYQLSNGVRQLFRIDGALLAHEHLLRALSPSHSVVFSGQRYAGRGLGDWPMLVPFLLSCGLAFWHWLWMSGCRWLVLRRARVLFGREDEVSV